MSLRKRISVTAFLSAMFALGYLSIGSNVKAQEAVTCSEATLQGDYGLQISGFQVSGAGFVPLDSVGLARFDGKGNYSGKGSEDDNGIEASPTTSGTYRVSPDCRVSITANITGASGTIVGKVSIKGVIVQGAQEILGLPENKTGNSSGTAIYKKIF